MNRLKALIDECQIEQFGFSKWFASEAVLKETKLEDATPISAWILDNYFVQTAVARLDQPLDIAVLGWMDEVVLEVPFTFEGVRGLRDAAIQLDSLEMDQPGDSALLVTHDWLEFLLVYVSIDNEISVDRLRRQPIPTASFRLIHPAESELVGHWTLEDSGHVVDATCRRIEFLLGSYLVQLGRSPEGGATLFRDPTDLRLWELTYPNGNLPGGGPPLLRCVSLEQAGLRHDVVI